jgi:glycosyltransferase involved in cell wall biosynthesis
VHVTAIVNSPDHVCCRYRLRAFEPALAEAGHVIEYRARPSDWWSRLWSGRGLAQADVVILQRRLLPRWELLLLRRAAKRLIFDLDDAVFLRDSYSPKGGTSARRHLRFRATVRAADSVVAGNRWLCEQVRAAGAARTVVRIPTCVDPGRYPLARHHRAGESVQLIWVGSASTLQGLRAVVPLLEALGQRVTGLSLKLVCDRFLTLHHLPVTACPWTEQTEAAEIAAADVGISWLPTDEWSRGKCGLKVLQYMAAGLPVVANPVGVQAELVRHGESGFLATTEAEWVAAVGRLARDPDLRRRMGAAGRKRVEADFSVRAGARRWLELLDAVALPARAA